MTGGGHKHEGNLKVLDIIQIYTLSTNEWFIAENRLLRASYLHTMVSGPKIIAIGGLREQISNRFTYILGQEERKELPEKLNTMIMDPLYTYNGVV